VHRDGIIAVDIMASEKTGTPDTGMTSDLAHRALEYRKATPGGFTKRLRRAQAGLRRGAEDRADLRRLNRVGERLTQADSAACAASGGEDGDKLRP
jgi:hypothetical protein